MKTDPPQQFSLQITLWAESIIAQGRSPFRRVEHHPPLLCAGGEVRPSLVVWINRDSFMAGGILLISTAVAEETLDSGRRCAQALGLRHFGTWSAQEIVVWEETACELRRHYTLPLPPGTEDSAVFRSALFELLEQFKLCSVLGATPPSELSPYYIANLARSALEAALVPQIEAARLAQSEGRVGISHPPARMARRKGALVLLRLMGLLATDRLPLTIQPEGLERAMTFALDGLPAPLRQLLLPGETELPLTSEAAIRFHHLFRRLGQLQLFGNRQKAAEVLEILLTHEGKRLGGHPLPKTSGTGPMLLINPDRLVPEAVVEVASSPLLALTGLLRELRQTASLPFQVESCFLLPRERVAGQILGTLADRRLPPPAERQEMAARLRASWPNRRFPLSAGTPRWAWEFLHLLGLTTEGAQLDLNLPDGWLTAEYAAPLLDIIREQFTLDQLGHIGHGLQLRLKRGVDPERQTLLTGPAGARQIPWRRLREGHRTFLPLALYMPAGLFHILTDDSLQPADAVDWSVQEPEIFLFSRSSLGRLLWLLVSGGAPFPERNNLPEQAKMLGWHLPATQILNRLRPLAGSSGDPPTQFSIDRELTLAMNLPVPFPDLLPPRPPAVASHDRRPWRSAELAAEIIRIVFADGIPEFPEHYLYSLYRPVLQHFTFTGPVRSEGSFFGQISLRDASGMSFTVEGEETARALELASHSGRVPVALPLDRQLTQTILCRYCDDLRQLRRNLLRQCHLRVADARAADNLAHRLWKSHSLPPLALLEE